jgi:hypothetical protein
MATDKKVLMKKIVDKVGRDRAIEIVTQAYNTELITTWISRLDEARNKIGGPRRTDHLSDALERVVEVVDLAP